MPDSPRQSRSRIVVDTSNRHQRHSGRRNPTSRNTEVWIAISIIGAATFATFLALFLTSRPFNPETASLAPQQTVPSAPLVTPSPKASPSGSATPQTKPSPEATPTAAGELSVPVDDASIQSRIDTMLTSDPVLSKLDVSTLVENGKVTIVGSVRSAELKQRVERTIRTLKGVTNVDNQLVVNEASP